MHSARAQRRVDVAASTKPGALAIPSHAVLGDRPCAAPRARGRRRRTHRAAPRCAARRGRTRRPRAAPASRGSAAPRTPPPAPPPAPSGPPASPRTSPRAPSARRAGPPRAGAARAAREKQNARWGTRAQSAARRTPTRAADPAEVLAPVGAAPHLVPVDDQLEAAPAGARAAAASSEKYGNEHVCTTS